VNSFPSGMRGQKRVEDARKRPSLQTEAGARITASLAD
jgi:hypothetical protein